MRLREFSKDRTAQIEHISESARTESQARIEHVEDLVFWEGSNGAMRALDALRSLENNEHKKVTLKWDGSPGVVFGRNSSGKLILTDKSGWTAKGYNGKTTSGESLENMLLSRSGGKNKQNPSYRAFAHKMRSVFDLFENAVPKQFRGFFKGDILYFTTPPIKNNNYVFKPNIVEYAIDVNSNLGKQVALSAAGVVIHQQLDLEGNNQSIENFDIFQGTEVLVVPPVSVEKPAQVERAQAERLEQIIRKNAKSIDQLFMQATLVENKIKDFPKILYTYTNSKVDTGFENLGNDFFDWLEAQTRITDRKKENVKNHIQENATAFRTLWIIVSGLSDIKNSIIEQFDSYTTQVKQSMSGEKGGEGYVLAHSEGDIKLVPRQTFTRLNRAMERT